jgi:uncharacterized Ntn-hydrolase superfamily protein
MTWSIVARDPKTGHFGIAVTTCAFAVGARVPFVATGVGAIASQSFMNPFYGLRGLELMRSGIPPDDILAVLTKADAGRGDRQVHMMDLHGRFAAHTGSTCVPWCGHLIRDYFSVAGNMLANGDVIERTADVMSTRQDLPFPQRMIEALKAGQAVGGDKRGKQSAGLLIHDTEEYSRVDLRVDDHAEPLVELERLEAVSRQRYIHFRAAMPSRANPSGVVGREAIEATIAKSMAEAGKG